ncbi:MAG: 50S ribosomal protein L25 [Firmicutes bacterium]|jgi:large subunit ribosomal protein L25|nr:50S ribosomal protein L25 [Bacillota bacterium]
MERAKLVAVKREQIGTIASKALRNRGKLPGVVYGGSVPNGSMEITLDNYEFERAIAKNSVDGLFDLDIEGQVFTVHIADIHRHPIRRTFYNVDLRQIDMTVVQVFRVPIIFNGTPVGVSAGGVLETQNYHVEVLCLPINLPESLEVDISEQDIGDVIYASDLEIPEDVELSSDPEMVLTVISTVAIEEDEDEVDEELEGLEEETEEDPEEPEKE